MNEPTWFKSTYSSANGQCVECALLPGGMAVRDTNDRNGVMLTITAEAWQRFAEGLK